MEKIEKIKQEFTDKYVVVDGQRPELARFRDHVGQIKTVNMSGRALVEFGDFYLNIGWHDIDLDYLKVVDKPEPKKPEAKKDAKKPADKPAAKKPADAGGEKKLSPLELARQQDAAKKAKPAADAPAKEQPAAASGAPAAADRSKMSVADMLAAARGDKAGGAPAAKSKPADDPPVEEEPAAEAPAEEVAEEAPAEPEPAAAGDGPKKVDRNAMSVDEMLAYCREVDAS